MASSISRLIEHPELRERLGREARDAAVRQHSWARYIADLEELLRTVVTDGRPRKRTATR
jgi:glycosyltransferase involved in cell wall biosynthesis